MPEGYWRNREVSRRSVIKSAGLGIAGLSGAVLVGCGGGGEEDSGGPQPESTVNRVDQILGGEAGTAAAGGATPVPAEQVRIAPGA